MHKLLMHVQQFVIKYRLFDYVYIIIDNINGFIYSCQQIAEFKLY